MEFKFNKYITSDGLPVGDMSKSEVIARRHAVYHSFILYEQRPNAGETARTYKLQIIQTRSGKEFWVEEESDIIDNHLKYNHINEDDDITRQHRERIIDFLIKKCKEKYHMEKYFGFYMKKIKGRQFVTFKCKVCGLPYIKRKSYIKNIRKRGFKTSCCSVRCKYKLLLQTHPSYVVIAKGILDWKPMKKIAEENGYEVNDNFRKTYENIIKALNYGRKGMPILEIRKKTGLGYSGIRKIFIEAKFKRRKYERGTP